MLKIILEKYLELKLLPPPQNEVLVEVLFLVASVCVCVSVCVSVNKILTILNNAWQPKQQHTFAHIRSQVD